MKQTKTRGLNPKQGEKEMALAKMVRNAARMGLLMTLVLGVTSLDAFAQAGSQGGNVRQNIDAASNFLGGLVGVLFVAFIIRGILKKKKPTRKEK